VVETDIANCFDAIPKDQLIHAVQERVCDQSVLKLLRVVLGAGVMTADGQVQQSVTGTPQGGPLSPLLCNAYLHQLDRVWSVREHGVLVRYCDLCRVRHKSTYAEYRIMPNAECRCWSAGLEWPAARHNPRCSGRRAGTVSLELGARGWSSDQGPLFGSEVESAGRSGWLAATPGGRSSLALALMVQSDEGDLAQTARIMPST
jgi:Reverse transcriptase (RNA-dependent DNA polymerase)